MNREIKFRAWDKEFKKLFPVLSIEFGGDNQVCLIGGSNYCQHIDDVILQQYTGLQDKNGKEIYEGDIVKNDRYTDVVIFKNGEFTARHYIDYGTYKNGMKIAGGSYDIIRGDCEVIGNIWENPELIK